MEEMSEQIIRGIRSVQKMATTLGWSGFHRLMVNAGGILLLVLSLYGAKCIGGGLRIPAFLIGIVALVDVISLMEVAMGLSAGSVEGMSGSRWLGAGDDPQDGVIRRGLAGQGRVYLEPRVPRVSGMGTEPVEVRGTPGGKIVYWPSGGMGLGASNDRLRIDQKRDPLAIRDSALGCGIVMLDERGRGVAMAERGCANLMYREVTSTGYGGPIGKIRVGGMILGEDGSRGEKSRKNAMGGMRTVGA